MKDELLGVPVPEESNYSQGNLGPTQIPQIVLAYLVGDTTLAFSITFIFAFTLSSSPFACTFGSLAGIRENAGFLFGQSGNLLLGDEFFISCVEKYGF